MDNKQIKELVNYFCKVTLDQIDLSAIDFSTHVLVLRHVDGAWDLIGAPKEDVAKLRPIEATFPFPDELPVHDKMDAAIELAGYISEKLKRHFASVKANQNRSTEARKASAKKAATTRWNREKQAKKYKKLLTSLQISVII